MELIFLARPVKWRRIENVPTVMYFAPSKKDDIEISENILMVEELEAIRLKDLEGLEQEECAHKMEVSRPTFQRILISAREKIADSLVNGKAIRIDGGNFTQNICRVKCLSCGKDWDESFEKMDSIINKQAVCPVCGSSQIICVHGGKGRFCRGNCRRHGRKNQL
jgi:predicted DNA-binding protein (UPF0251 family)